MTEHRYLIVIKAALQAQANTLALAWDATGGQDTWTVPLYPSAGPYDTPSAYWACMPLTDAAYSLFTSTFSSEIAAGDVLLYDADVVTPEAVLTELGLATTDPGQEMA